MVPYSGKFSRFSRAEQSMRKLKLGETPTHRYFTCKSCGGCGFLALKREYYNRENFFIHMLYWISTHTHHSGPLPPRCHSAWSTPGSDQPDLPRAGPYPQCAHSNSEGHDCLLPPPHWPTPLQGNGAAESSTTSECVLSIIYASRLFCSHIN